MKNKKILIIGGTGFIGYHVTKKALKKKWSVTSISLHKPVKKFFDSVKYLQLDITKKKNYKFIKHKKFDYVLNLAGYIDHSENEKIIKTHYYGTKNLANFFIKKKIKSFIQLSSGLEYGKNNNPHNEKDKCYPNSMYAKAKFLSTKYLLNLYNKKKFPVTIIRLFQAYGPYQKLNRLIPQIINESLTSEFFLCTKGNQSKDFLYISDLVNLIFRIFANKSARGEIFNAGSGEKIKIKTLIKLIVKLCKKGKPIFGAIKMRSDESDIMVSNINKSKKLLNWKNKISLLKGLKKTILHYKNEIKKK